MLNDLFPNYKVHCTLEQSNKSLTLGAPFGTNVIPTVEQMIDWLETQGIHTYAHKIYSWSCHCYWTSVTMWETKNHNIIFQDDHLSGKEVILAAIDVALEYLEIHNQ